ncbi:hypothetical protein [Aurantimonas coralicida]|uniref:hypothetical protein n=1 Tax=Aurantimonas coralicida TaxID=182270 RepID=UPI0023823ED9|nr:hypothetical protein [Aurantimonas coralicida]MDE0922203.1 hypothetical protein [Aurantimonas coralicida]
MSDQNDNENGIQGVMVEKLEGVSQLPDGNVALIIRNGDAPIGLVFTPQDAQDAAKLLASVHPEDGASNGDAA